MAPTENSQTVLSSYFSPSPLKSTKRRERPESPIDLTGDDSVDEDYLHSDEPPIKKIRVVRPPQSQPQFSTVTKPKKYGEITKYTQSTFFSLLSASPQCSASLTQGGSTAEQWIFKSQSSSTDSRPREETRWVSDPVKEAEKANRHEAFKKKLLTYESQYRLRHGVSAVPDKNLDTSLTPHLDDLAVIDADDNNDSRNDSDPGFKEVMKIFSHSHSTSAVAADKGKGKQTASARTKLTSHGQRSVTTKRKTNKSTLIIGPSGEPYTPLELQVLKLKEDNPGTLLMIEVGYKYRFFGGDAKIAAQELGIVAYIDRNFTVAFVPEDRLSVHLKKLLAKGHRVGVVSQVETAALKKVSENRNAPFERRLTHLYTATTFVDDLDSADELDSYSPPPFMCLIEEPRSGRPGDVNVATITICPSTGDVVWDDFEDSLMRIELETRLTHARPVELLVPGKELSESTSKMLQFFTRNSTTGERIRLETIKNLMTYTDAFSSVSKFYTNRNISTATSTAFQSGKLIAEVTDFPKRVVVALAHAVEYLSKFSLADVLLETKFFSRFTTQTHMLLAANTLINLEVYRNETDYTVEGSLIHILDKTQTKFGARLLKSWIGRPLVNKSALQQRVNAVEEILANESETLTTLRGVLSRLPDLARGLCRIQYGQCTPQELAKLLPAFQRIGNVFIRDFQTPADVGLKSPILNEIIYSLPKIRPAMKEYINAVNIDQAKEGSKELMWQNPDRFPGLVEAAENLHRAEVDLKEELRSIRKLLRIPSLEWTNHLTDEYLIELKRANKPPIPANWVLHSKTKHVVRYRPATSIPKVDARARFQEMLKAESHKAYQDFLQEISINCYSILRDVINKLAMIDCLNSLARTALDPGYVKPQFTDENSLEIIQGRHPLIENMSDRPYFSNSVTMGFGKPRSKIITGPNMGGKSSFVRMIALIVLMAQIGSYVPAESVKMGLHDSILTRMGASDDLAKGRSTFMVEMSETSDILRTATSRSLVILDELGRGTSTFDGMAIAHGVLQELVDQTQSKTLFITHYPAIAANIERKYPKEVENVHMGYTSNIRFGGRREITFLYKVKRGITTESFGIECARLASMPEHLLEIASERAQLFQSTIESRIRQNKTTKAVLLIKRSKQEEGSQLQATLTQLRELVQSLSKSTST